MSKSWFSYNGQSKELNSKTPPKAISTLFKLDMDSINLIDEEGNLHFVVAEKFDPSLETGKRYEVDGMAQRVTTVALVDADRDRAIVSVLSDTEKMREQAGLLRNAPQAALVVECLTVLACCTKDPSLVNPRRPHPYLYLTSPESFRASLYQVAAMMCRAFQDADYSMGKIWAALSDVPEFIEETIEILMNPDSPGAASVLEINRKAIAKASATCKSCAIDTVDAFKKTLLTTQELIEGATASSSHNQDELEVAERKMAELEREREAAAAEQLEVEMKAKEQKRIAEEALGQFKEANARMSDTGEMFRAALADAFVDVVRAVPKLVMSFASGGVGAKVAADFLSGGGEKENGLANTLTRTGKEAMQKASSTAFKTVLNTAIDIVEKSDVQELMKSKDHLVKNLKFGLENNVAEAGSELTKAAKQFIEGLEKLEEGDEEGKKSLDKCVDDVKVAKELDVGKDTESSTVQTHSTNSSGSSILGNLKEATTNSFNLYKEQQARTDAMEQKRSEIRREMARLTSDLANVNMDRLQFEEIIEYLRKGIQLLSMVTQTWSELTLFFQEIEIVINTPLASALEQFNEYSALDVVSVRATRKNIAKTALKACGLCSEVRSCCSIYRSVSAKFIMPIMTGVASNLVLEKAAAQAKLCSMTYEISRHNMEVETMIQAKLEEKKEETREVMTRYSISLNAIQW